MAFDPNPADTQVPSSAESELTNVSLAEFVHASHTSPRPASTVLDVARYHAFTGEITFNIDPIVRVYLEGGVAYLAEVDGSPSVSQQLLDAHVIEAPQLERGIVRVGDLEHLGRLFDRDASIDRDAVMVVVEHHTDQLVQLLADHVTSSANISPYRHHPSGVHRWFVAPIEATASTRPLSDVAQVDRSVVDELPGLGRPGSDMTIEWTEPDPSGLGVPADSLVDLTTPTDADLQAELDRFDADEADWAAGAAAGFASPVQHAVPSPLGEFHIVWPDGTTDPDLVNDVRSRPVAPAPPAPPAPPTTFACEPDAAEPAAPPAAPPAPAEPTPPPVAPTPGAVASPVDIDEVTDEVADLADIDELADTDEVDDRPLLPPRTTTPAPSLIAPLLSTPVAPEPPVITTPPTIDLLDAPAPTAEASDVPAFVAPVEVPVAPERPAGLIAPVVLDQMPAPDAAIPEDVAAAVRRALEAIDEASTKPIVIAQRETPLMMPKLDMSNPAALDTSADSSPAAAPLLQSPRLEAPPAPPVPELVAPAVATPTPPPVVEAPQETVVAEPAPVVSVAPPPPPPVEATPAPVATPAPEVEPALAADLDAAPEVTPLDAAMYVADEPDEVPEPGQASVVFTDEASLPDNERRGALRRLISSLRNNVD